MLSSIVVNLRRLYVLADCRSDLSRTSVTRTGQYNYRQPSSSSIRSVSSTTQRRVGRSIGFPNGCYCALVSVIKTSTTAKNHGRRFYGCPNDAWLDEAIIEEFEEIRLVVEQQANLIRYFKSKESQAILDCIDKPHMETIRRCIQKTDIELAQLKKDDY
ncbi:unnamed protein product [Arabis nemorensis]|uniref:Uncharacterized protein n=1 Tax=Arabis nemorensis TaxID=586526 RepID=A0A565AU59_9BRAS|nr:unnamed protein product [Arabis nemorensis]